MRRRSGFALVLAITAAFLAAGCASTPPAAVDVSSGGVKSTVGIKTNRPPQPLE